MSSTTNLDMLLSRSSFESFDSQRINVYAAGKNTNPVVVIIIPYAVPVGMIEETIRLWSEDFFVITWESRCCLTLDEPFEISTKVSVDAQVQDLLLVLKHLNVSVAHVVGWCTGAIVALKAAFLHPQTIKSAVLVMGTYGFTEKDDIVLSDYQIEINTFMPKVAADRRAAHVLHRLVFQNQAFMETMQNEWSSWTRIPFSDPESLFRFANSAIRILDEDVGSYARFTMVPCLVVTSPNDKYAHPEHSRHVARVLPNARLFEDLNGDHYSIAVPKSSTSTEAVQFIRDVSRRLLEVDAALGTV